MKHPLFEDYYVYRKRKKLEAPTGFFYEKHIGAWLNVEDKSLLVLAKDFAARATKKLDVETGEDNKGQ